MTGKVKKIIERELSRAGFSAAEEYSVCADERLEMKYIAYWRIKEISLGEMKIGSPSGCAAEFTAEVRMFGARRAFNDRAELMEKAEKFMSELFFSSTMIVKKICCGEVLRDMRLGRLEYPLTVTLCTTVKRGE